MNEDGGVVVVSGEERRIGKKGIGSTNAASLPMRELALLAVTVAEGIQYAQVPSRRRAALRLHKGLQEVLRPTSML